MLVIFLAASLPDWNSRADVIELDNKNFKHYLNADHPVSGRYQLVSDIDLSGSHWTPVGNRSTPFSVILDGNYHVISNLNVSTSAANTPTGLFGSLYDSTIRNILLNSPRVISSGGSSPTGALVGEAKRSRIEEVVNSFGYIKTDGDYSPAGGIAGQISDNSIIRGSLNTDSVVARGEPAFSGGIAGLAYQKSSISNSLNTGGIDNYKYTLYRSAACSAGIVGSLRDDSIVSSNMNTGFIYTAGMSGGIAGKAVSSTVSNNLNTGQVASPDYGYIGGIAGRIEKSSLISKNLNAGSVFTWSHEHKAGGIAGKADTSMVHQNVNAGVVHTMDNRHSIAGGISGDTSDGTILDNLNVGAIKTKEGSVGGITASAKRSTSVLNNVNTGSVNAEYSRVLRFTYESPIAAYVTTPVVIENNLNTFTGYRKAHSESVNNGQNIGVKTVSKNTLKSDLNGLSSTLWNAGNTTQLPMIKGVNAPYRVLSRINGTKQIILLPLRAKRRTRIQFQFPEPMEEFATPGDNPDATLFNHTRWNNEDGYLPFPKGFAKAQTLLAGIDCTPGGFACTGDEDITSTPSSTPSSSAQPSTTTALQVRPSSTSESINHSFTSATSSSMASSVTPSSSAQPSTTTALQVLPSSTSEPVSASVTRSKPLSATSPAFEISPSTTTLQAIPSSSYTASTRIPSVTAGTSPTAIYSPSPLDECPPPEGTPLFQTYDQTNQQMYVVIQPVQPSEGFVLARYNGLELDKQFGLCGRVTYTTPASHFGIPESCQSLSGQVIHGATGAHLDLVVTLSFGKTILLEFPVSATQKYPAQFSVRDDVFPENVQINDIAHYQGDLYLAGKVDNSLFIGRYRREGLQFFKTNEKHEEEQISRLKVSPDGEHLYVAGTGRNEEGSYPVFIRQHDSQQLAPVTLFGDNGEERVTTTDTGNSQQDILVQGGWVYVATVNPQGEKLSIRRFAPDSGQMDDAFIIDDTVGEPSSTPEPFSNVRLMATGDHLHALIYNSEGQLSVVTYKDQVNVHQFNTTFKTATAKFIRPIFVDNKAYLAVGHVDTMNDNRRHARMSELSLDLQNYMPLTGTRGVSSSGSIPGWGIALVVTGVTVTAVVVVAAVIRMKRKSSLSGSQPDSYQLQWLVDSEEP